jgi:hypothetical protein
MVQSDRIEDVFGELGGVGVRRSSFRRSLKDFLDQDVATRQELSLKNPMGVNGMR